MDHFKAQLLPSFRKSSEMGAADKGECGKDRRAHHQRAQSLAGPLASTITTATAEGVEPIGAACGEDGLPQSMKNLSIKDVRHQSEMSERVVEGKVKDKGNPKGQGIVVEMTVRSSEGRHTKVTYTTEKVVGNGSFGVVHKASCAETGQTVAIKKVLQDRRFKNRELQIMRLLDHPNIVRLQHCFATRKEDGETYLHLVLEYIPDTVYRICRHYSKNASRIPILYTKIYVYQMCRALAHLHKMGICHRDIKPQNLLVNIETQQLKLCDFGSAKVLVKGEPNISYICSRYYRAPELIFGATEYTTAIDMWSIGCVMAELLLGQPMFPGESGIDQLVEIVKVLGTPTKEQIVSMNPTYTEFKFPQVDPCSLKKVFKKVPADTVDLVSKFLVYTPADRITAIGALAHPCFDELRNAGGLLPDGSPMPQLFNWVPGELDCTTPEQRTKLASCS
ncbi:unnamed protein product [Ostreobium quekettii]|uniref:Protein kinase domain-containing protein n=1 Tax=Ostreobium quekettii TaxID=121088 RepID=A0A8S1IX75_9CHLO|nr:unnamed protein product [Ostreobium quekettii]|eukprot:evm.model.scf_40.10 EVM.evm.TU.scf_40.10   scf_40:76586-82585(+)